MVKTPNLDALAAEGVLFARHYANAAPCGPSRASLHTGLYLQNHRSGTNGTPLDARHTNWALEAASARLRPGAVRLHRHQPRSARRAGRQSLAAHLRGAAARHPPDRALWTAPDALDRLAERQGLRGAAGHPLRLRLARAAVRSGRTARPQPRPLAYPGRGRRHRLPDRPADRLPEGARAGRSSPTCRCCARTRRSSRPSPTTRCTIPRRCPASRARPRRGGGPAASVARLAARRSASSARPRTSAAAAAEGGLLRPDEPGRRRDRPADRVPEGERAAGTHADDLHLATTASRSATTG